MVYEDMLPHYLALGVDYNTFMECNPYELRAYDRAFKIKKEIQDYRDWTMGQYMMSAVSTVLSHMIDKHSNAKYIEKPIHSDGNSLSDDPEANERLAVAEMEQFIAVLHQQGDLPETQINL